jgi:translation elongation factor EF-1beta
LFFTKYSSYITGYALSADDKAELANLKGLPSFSTHPNTYRWATHIIALTGLPVQAGAAGSASAPTAKKAAKEEDFDDMFGGGDDEEELNEEGETAAEAAATKARHERMEAARKLKEEKDAKDGKKKGEKAVEKSLLVLDVKPWEADTDMEKVWHMIKEYQQEGLSWGQTFKLEPVAYGIKKLVMTATIVDSQVLVDDVTDAIERLEDHVQSCEVASMNKI